MDLRDIQASVFALQSDSVLGEGEAWEALKPLGSKVVPHLLNAYPEFSKWRGRVSLVYHSMRYARVSEDAFRLGILALQDRAKLVRYRACMLLAYSQRDDALPYLRDLLNSPCAETVGNSMAAIDAIESKNHHYFLDRDHTGNIFLALTEEDRNEIDLYS